MVRASYVAPAVRSGYPICDFAIPIMTFLPDGGAPEPGGYLAGIVTLRPMPSGRGTAA